MTPKTQATRAKIGKWVYSKFKDFSPAKETMKWRDQLEQEKIFANHTSDKVLISKIEKELISITRK
jgi:hypothetical protein